MIARKNTSFIGIMYFAGHHLIWLGSYMALITILYKVVGWTKLSIPWLPVSLIGTAVAFYLGFKSSQSYDRTWEARKIWGAIVNSSRSWGSLVNAYISNSNLTQTEIQVIKSRLIYRHIGWLYTLREQLLVPTPWEHVSLKGQFGKVNVQRREKFGVGLFKDYLTERQKRRYFADVEELTGAANKATQIIRIQAQDLASQEENGNLSVLKHIEMQKILNCFYDEQGKAERIKRFPFPRQYANMSFIFTCIFIFLLPFGIVGEFAKLGGLSVWLTIPVGMLAGWIYIVMELVGDYSENPFEGLSTDIPMLSMCRTIEIDLLQMLGETEIPTPIQTKHDILL